MIVYQRVTSQTQVDGCIWQQRTSRNFIVGTAKRCSQPPRRLLSAPTVDVALGVSRRPSNAGSDETNGIALSKNTKKTSKNNGNLDVSHGYDLYKNGESEYLC